MSVAIVVLAAGSGTRVGADRNKILLPLRGTSVLSWSVRTALAVPQVSVVVVVARAEDRDALTVELGPVAATSPEVEVRLTDGGATRHASEIAALAALSDVDADLVVVHDAARPLATPDLYAAVIASARQHGGAVPTVAALGLVRRGGGPLPGLSSTRGGSVHAAGVQTPQAFRAAALREAYRWAAESGFEGTDTAGCVAAWARATDASVQIAAVPSSPVNLKVTYAGDLPSAAALLPG